MDQSASPQRAPQAGAADTPRSSKLGIFGWVLADWAGQPFQTVILTFVFAPYFAQQVASDGATGQALWGLAIAIAGFLIAILSPIFGAVADHRGALKPWVAAFAVCAVLGSTALWFATPGGGAPIAWILFAVVLLSVGIEFTNVFLNAMMPGLVPAYQMGRLSGWGFAAGYVGGLVSLLLIIGFMVASPETGLTLLGIPPVFGLEAGSFEGDRASGPFSALWFLVFALPFFLFTPDRPQTGLPFSLALRFGLQDLLRTFREARTNAQAILFLIAHMLYKDGLSAMFAFGGIYAASVFDWPIQTIGVFGLLLSVAAVFGAIAGGYLDDRLGPFAVCMGTLILCTFTASAVISVSADRIFFLIPVTPAEPGSGLFASTSEKVYVAFGLMLGFCAGPIQSASRTMLARLAPREQMTQYFGLFALSGKLTTFAGPLLVSIVTAWTADQRWGISVILVFLIGGLVILFFTGPPRSRVST